jgi:hypothetical protein
MLCCKLHSLMSDLGSRADARRMVEVMRMDLIRTLGALPTACEAIKRRAIPLASPRPRRAFILTRFEV